MYKRSRSRWCDWELTRALILMLILTRICWPDNINTNPTMELHLTTATWFLRTSLGSLNQGIWLFEIVFATTWGQEGAALGPTWKSSKMAFTVQYWRKDFFQSHGRKVVCATGCAVDKTGETGLEGIFLEAQLKRTSRMNERSGCAKGCQVQIQTKYGRAMRHLIDISEEKQNMPLFDPECLVDILCECSIYSGNLELVSIYLAVIRMNDLFHLRWLIRKAQRVYHVHDITSMPDVWTTANLCLAILE